MEGRVANLNKVRQQTTSRTKTRNISNPIQPSIVTSPVLAQEEQPYMGNASLFLEPTNNPLPEITTPKDLRKVLSPMSPTSENDDINLEQEKPKDPESRNFLASLIAQGVSGFGTGLMGGSAQDIMRSGNMFNQMRETDINRQNRLAQNELFRSEKAEEKKERQAELKKREEQAKSLTDPNSPESKKKREVYRSLGYKVGDNFSAADLENPLVMQTLKSQMEQSKLAAMPRQGGGMGGVGKPKEEKESKDQKETDEFTSNNETIRKQLEEYRKAIKAIKSPLGYAAEKAKAEGLANSLLLKIKTAEKTGSLDEGSIAIIQKLTGSPDYTRNDVIDSTINQALSNLNDNVETITRGKGTVNKFYKPYIPPEINDDREKAIIQNYYNNPNDPDNLKMYQDLRNKKGF